MVQQELLLDVRNLSVDYYAANGSVHAVRDVSFTLKRGEILGLAGESGCGKSTLAYAVARLLRPPAYVTGGEVLYYPARRPATKTNARRSRLIAAREVLDILDLTERELRVVRWSEISFVFQSAMNALNPVLNIGTQITDVIQTHRPDMNAQARRDRAADLLKMVGITPDRLKSYPHELSGGMRQRVVIAIALALQPELIIMDEPTTALDVVVQREILQLVSALCKETSTALIFITHDLSLLIELADKIAIMYAGKMIEHASSRDIYLHPRHPYSYGLLNSFPTIYGPRRMMVGIPGTPPDLRKVEAGCPFRERCPFAFKPCATVHPPLQTVGGGSEEQLVACHLYDTHHAQKAPATEALAAGFAALAEGSTAR